MANENIPYEDWLTTIANTRLLYNTMEELEQMLDNHSIHSNGIKRSFFTQQRLRAAFRDLKCEVDEMTDGQMDLESVLIHYKRAWCFFRDNLYRRTKPEQIALELLSCCYPPYLHEGISRKKQEIYRQVIVQGIDIPLLLCMLMNVMPGYDSKGGDIADMPMLYEKMMQLLDKFTKDKTSYERMPAITEAREETHKSRIMLLYHLQRILDSYECHASPENLYELAEDMKQQFVNLDIAGYWNECGGELLFTKFWQIEEASNFGNYFLTSWQKGADNTLTGIRFQLTISKGTDGNLVCYIMRPTAILKHMKKAPLEDADHVWYQLATTESTPLELNLVRKMYSGVWQDQYNFSRCTDEEVVAQYDRWLNHDCTIVKKYSQLEYYFDINLYAVTPTHLYIPTDQEGEYYKIPRSAHDGLEHIQLGDAVGTMQMNNKTYLAFDELLLFIRTTREELQRYGIEIVRQIV